MKRREVEMLWKPGKIELLAPARDLRSARAAIDCGADAVYMGGPRFGARQAAGNSVADIAAVYGNLENTLHLEISAEQKSNADSIYNLVRYGIAGGSEGWMPGADVPFIGADGFCSPIGSGWERRVTSEFGNRVDPITGKRKGHGGMDLAVPSGTPIRAALPGTVTVSKYNAGGYGYYVMIDHGNGLATLYGHCSKLLAKVGQTVEAGDIIALSGSTGRSTGPHLHFEVRVNGERTNPRAYLPKG